MENHLILVGPTTFRDNALEKTLQRACLDSPQEILFIDGGAHHRETFESAGHQTLFSIGDGDSLKEGEPLDKLHPRDKAQSDFLLCLNHLPEKYNEKDNLHLHGLGLWGERLDHQLAIIGETYAHLRDHPMRRFSFYDDQGALALAMTWKTYSGSYQGVMSVFTLDDSTISLKGDLKYTGTHSFHPLTSLGLSNVAHGDFQISCEHGIIISFSGKE